MTEVDDGACAGPDDRPFGNGRCDVGAGMPKGVAERERIARDGPLAERNDLVDRARGGERTARGIDRLQRPRGHHIPGAVFERRGKPVTADRIDRVVR